MTDATPATPRDTAPGSERSALLDVGVADPEAPANAIPNVLANLSETETWRNAATVMMGLLLLGLGWWAYNGVRDAIARTQAGGLDAILGTVVRGVDVWANEHRADAKRLASEPEIVTPALRLASAAREGVALACRRNEDEELRQRLPAMVAHQDEAAFMLLDREGRVLVTNLPMPCGERIRAPHFRQKLDRALDGLPQFVHPLPDPQLYIDDANGGKRPLAWALAPVRATTSAPTMAVLAIGILADREFARLFASARVGTTTEAFAFTDDSVMLTSTRAANEFVEAGYFPKHFGSAVFSVPVRDPGGDLASGHLPKIEPGARPLTLAAALAIAARDKSVESEQRGILVEPYRTYSGREVLGAWRWLPAYDIGVVAERDVDEAFAALRYLRISFSVIAGFIVLSLIAALTSGVSLARLRRQFGRLQRFGAYTLERELSEGGMATIYLARHALLKRPTAVKVLKKTVGNDEFIHRFEREVQLASQLRHPNTVQIYDFGRNRDGQPYYVMEYLEGVTLTELVRHSGPVPPGRAIHVLRQVAAALREAHKRGMIHRDVKPDNIMLCRRGEDDFVKLLDFGLVKDIERDATRDVTKQIKILGTPRYMSPERIRNPSDVDARSDLYALGAVGYFLLTGKQLFEEGDNLDISNQVLHTPAPRVSASIPSIPEHFDALIAALLEKDRGRRPASADALIEALDRLSSRLAWTQRDAMAWWESYQRDAPVPAK
ncbi:MAG TPA: serine/threonine-protein kinase [Casimicrobiaceae bacterium]|nr:serine/threonine-protein kinase [Casimicrobiaceae bacterium]